jgi:hypothetical protein
MFRIDSPNYNIDTIYTNCVTRTDDVELRLALAAERARVLARCAVYADEADDMTLFSIAPEPPINLIREDLGEIYDRVVVRGSERYVFLGIKASAPYNRCPLCAHRDVSSLDHYLPKENYPEFAVLPMNLVPCCSGCNGEKRAFIPNAEEEQLFHPYFDDWGTYDLLTATIEIGAYIDVYFGIADTGVPDMIRQRAQNHFDRLGLDGLYSANAAAELISKRDDFHMIFESAGPEALREDLAREATSRLLPFRNAWQPALYRALADCAPFWQGHYVRIETPTAL